MYVSLDLYVSKGVSFKRKENNITKEEILKLRGEGKRETEIIKILNISTASYYRKLKLFNLPSKKETYNSKLEEISKEQFENFLRNKTPIEEVCKTLKITTTAYYNLMEKFGLRSYILGANKKAVTKEQIQSLLDQNLSVMEISNRLNICKDAYFKLLNKFNIITKHKESIDRISQITKSDIENLISSGKTYPEISEILQISASTLHGLIIKFKIKTKLSQSRENIASITKEQIEDLINSGKKTEEICKELDIQPRTYTDLLTRFGIVTKLKQAKKNILNTNKEDIQALVDKGLTVEEIAKALNVTNASTVYRLFKRYHIKYNYKHHSGEINIPKVELQKTVKEWESVQAVEDKLKISNTCFYEKAKQANVNTILGDSIQKINSLNPKEIQDYIDQGATKDEICELFGIPKRMYPSVIRRYNLTTREVKLHLNAKKITKDLLEERLLSGKSTMELCQEFGVSLNTLLKKMRKFGLK